MIMSNRNQGQLSAAPRVFGIENHNYYLRHVRENFLTYAGKVGIRPQGSKDLLKEVFNKIAYAPTGVEYGVAVEEIRKYKSQLAAWVKRNEPEQWAQSKFTKERWGRLNNNAVESWNNWMCSLRRMSIPWLISGHIQKLD